MKTRRWLVEEAAASAAFVAPSTVHVIESRGNASGSFETDFDGSGCDVRRRGLDPPRLLMLSVAPVVTVEIDLSLS